MSLHGISGCAFRRSLEMDFAASPKISMHRSSGSQRERVAADLVVAIEQCTGRHDVDADAEQVREILFEMNQIEKRAAWFELHQEVDVARVGGLAAGNGSEHRDRSGVLATNQRDDLVPVLLDEQAKRRTCKSLVTVLGNETQQPLVAVAVPASHAALDGMTLLSGAGIRPIVACACANSRRPADPSSTMATPPCALSRLVMWCAPWVSNPEPAD